MSEQYNQIFFQEGDWSVESMIPSGVVQLDSGTLPGVPLKTPSVTLKHGRCPLSGGYSTKINSNDECSHCGEVPPDNIMAIYRLMKL